MFPFFPPRIWLWSSRATWSAFGWVLWGLLIPVGWRTTWFRVPSNRVAEVVSGEVRGVTSSVQNEGTKTEQRISANVLGKTPRKEQSCLFVRTRRVNWTMEWRSTGKQRPLFAETDFIQHCLLSAGLARVCFWLVPREGAGQVLSFCDNHEDCNYLCFVIHRSHMATEGGFQVSFSII